MMNWKRYCWAGRRGRSFGMMRRREIMAYCNNDKCEYWEDGACEYDDTLHHDENGTCTCSSPVYDDNDA